MQPSDEYKEAARAKVKAEELLERRRTELQPLMVAEHTRGVSLSALAKLADYTPEHVRRIVRAHGIEGDPARQPPPAPARKNAGAAAHFEEFVMAMLQERGATLLREEGQPQADIVFTLPDGEVVRLDVKYVPQHREETDSDSH